MTLDEANLTIDYLKEMQEQYIEGEGYERHPLPEWYALDKAIETIEQTTWIPIECNINIRNLPFIKPQTGHWIRITNGGAMKQIYLCSVCHRQIEDDGIEALITIKYPYCHCGAKMVEPQESEGK